MSGPVFLAFGIWMLLTSAFTVLNALIGFVAAVAVSLLQPYRFSVVQLLQLAARTVLNLPRAVFETFLLVFVPHRHEGMKTHQLKKPDDPWSAFVETFIITFTPLTLVAGAEKDGKIQIHVVSRKELP